MRSATWLLIGLVAFSQTGCNFLLGIPNNSDPSLTQSGQIQVEVRFITVAESGFEQIGVDFNQPIAPGEQALPTPSPTVLPDANRPVVLPGDLLGGLPGGNYVLPEEATGGYLPGTVNNDDDAPVLVFPGLLSGLDTVLPRAVDVNVPATLGDPDGLIIGQHNPLFDQVFGRQLNQQDLTELLDLLDRDRGLEAEIIQAPVIIMRNGQRSLVQVASEPALTSLSAIPFLNGIRNLEVEPFTTQVGPTLDVQPSVTDDGRISLDVTWGTRAISVPLELTDVSREPTQFFVPVIETGTLRTAVQVADGETVLFGGVTSNNQTQRGVPLLNDLPVISRTFSQDAVIDDEKTLLILITPRIVSE